MSARAAYYQRENEIAIAKLDACQHATQHDAVMLSMREISAGNEEVYKALTRAEQRRRDTEVANEEKHMCELVRLFAAATRAAEEESAQWRRAGR